jgi:serine aminopeptidase S33 family
MSPPSLIEEPLQFGERGRLTGVLTRPNGPRSDELPAFVFLTAGVLHRVGPFRLYVRLARALAQSGFGSLRVDLAGVGDSAPSAGLSYRESVAADFKAIKSVLESRFGRTPLVLAGLCSGADNAVRLTATEPQVVGMVLLDPICFPDDGFQTRALIGKYTNPIRYVEAIRRRIKPSARAADDDKDPFQSIAIRNLPTPLELRSAFAAIRERNGRALAVFTQYARPYYNRLGQLESVLGIDGFRQCCTELYWPCVEHTFPLEVHRARLIDEITRWATLHRRFGVVAAHAPHRDAPYQARPVAATGP